MARLVAVAVLVVLGFVAGKAIIGAVDATTAKRDAAMAQAMAR